MSSSKSVTRRFVPVLLVFYAAAFFFFFIRSALSFPSVDFLSVFLWSWVFRTAMLGFVDASTRGLIKPIFKKQVANFLKELQDRNVFVIILTTPGFRDIQLKGDTGYERIKEFKAIVVFLDSLWA